FNISTRICAHPPCRDQFGDWLTGIDRELGRLEIPGKPLRGGLTTPVSILVQEVGLLKAFGVGPELPRIEFRAKRNWIVGDPFFDHALGVEQFSIRLPLEPQISSCFKVLHNGPDGPQRYSGTRGDLTIGCLDERGLAGKREGDLKASGVQSAEVIPTEVGWLVVANHVNEKPWAFEISVAGSNDERKMKLAAAFGNLTGKVRCDQQNRLAASVALGPDQCGSFEPVYGFDFGAEPVFTFVRGQFDDG